MAKEQQGSNLGMIAGVAAFSAVAGAVAAAMLTPKSGRELRGHIKGKAETMRDKAKDTLDKTTDKI